MKQKSTGERQSLLDNALAAMLEHRETLSTALSRYAARPLGTYEENGSVFSSQLAFYNFLLTGRWQKVRLQGGSYFRFRSGEPTGLNPFALAPRSASARRWTPSCWTTRLSCGATVSPACWKSCTKPRRRRRA